MCLKYPTRAAFDTRQACLPLCGPGTEDCCKLFITAVNRITVDIKATAVVYLSAMEVRRNGYKRRQEPFMNVIIALVSPNYMTHGDPMVAITADCYVESFARGAIPLDLVYPLRAIPPPAFPAAVVPVPIPIPRPVRAASAVQTAPAIPSIPHDDGIMMPGASSYSRSTNQPGYNKNRG